MSQCNSFFHSYPSTTAFAKNFFLPRCSPPTSHRTSFHTPFPSHEFLHIRQSSIFASTSALVLLVWSFQTMYMNDLVKASDVVEWYIDSNGYLRRKLPKVCPDILGNIPFIIQISFSSLFTWLPYLVFISLFRVFWSFLCLHTYQVYSWFYFVAFLFCAFSY